MTEVLLSSEKLVKQIAGVNDNVASDYIRASLTEAQEIGLKSILGKSLLDKLKALVDEDAVDAEGNEAYAELIDKCQYYLAYKTVSELTYKTTYKVTNFGVAKSNDENLQVPSFDEVAKIKDYYQSKADYYCIELQKFVIQNRPCFPELNECVCTRIRANLYSAASCGIFLGGPRGK